MNGRALHLLRGHCIDSSPMTAGIKRLTPDLVIMTPQSESPCLCIWSSLDVLEPVATAKKMAEDLSLSISRQEDRTGKYLIIVGGAKTVERGVLGEEVHWLTVPLMLQDSLESWTQNIAELLGHA